MKVADIDKQIEELQKKKERMLKQREYQRNFQNKKRSGKMDKRIEAGYNTMIEIIDSKGGFDMSDGWTFSQITNYVKSNFPTEAKIAKKIALKIIEHYDIDLVEQYNEKHKLVQY